MPLQECLSSCSFLHSTHLLYTASSERRVTHACGETTRIYFVHHFRSFFSISPTHTPRDNHDVRPVPPLALQFSRGLLRHARLRPCVKNNDAFIFDIPDSLRKLLYQSNKSSPTKINPQIVGPCRTCTVLVPVSILVSIGRGRRLLYSTSMKYVRRSSRRSLLKVWVTQTGRLLVKVKHLLCSISNMRSKGYHDILVASNGNACTS